MPYQMPEYQAEAAFAAYFEAASPSQLDGVQVVTRFAGDAIREPQLAIVASECTPDFEGDEIQVQTGNWKVKMTFTIRTHYKPGQPENALHDAYMGEVMDMLSIVDDTTGEEAVVSQLNTINTDADFTAYRFRLGSRRNATEGHSMTTEQEAELWMAPAKL